jgi:hypothetical protein
MGINIDFSSLSSAHEKLYLIFLNPVLVGNNLCISFVLMVIRV